MTSKLRLALPMAFIGVVGAACFLLLQSHASARVHMNYAHLNKIQKRLISETLASALGPQSTGLQSARRRTDGDDDNGGGPDGAPFTPPKSFGSAGGAEADDQLLPASSGSCSANIGNDVKVNQNCLNLTDPNLQGRGQANNEPSIAVDPFNSQHLVASDNNYIRGDGTCGSYFSLERRPDVVEHDGPQRVHRRPVRIRRASTGRPAATRRWHGTRAGTPTSAASCSTAARQRPPNPDQSSAFVVFRATQNDGGSWNFPGRYSATFTFDPTGPSGVLQDKALMAIDDNVQQPVPRPHLRDVDGVRCRRDGLHLRGPLRRLRRDVQQPGAREHGQPLCCTNTFGLPTPNGRCNENQFSDPFVGPDGSLYVAFDNFNNSTTSGNRQPDQVLLAKSTDGGQTFSAPVKVSDYYDLPECDAYQGAGADPGRACVPEKGTSTKSVFRATNYPSGAVDPNNPQRRDGRVRLLHQQGLERVERVCPGWLRRATR